MKITKRNIRSAVKEILKYLVVAFVGALLSYFVFPDLMKSIDQRIFGTTEIVVNITELSPLEKVDRLEDFSMMLGTTMNYGWLAAVKTGQPELNKIFGDTLIPDDFGHLDQPIEYSITITNKGSRTARGLLLSLSGDNLKTDHERDKSSNIDFVNCGGFGNDFSCDVNIEDVAPNEKAAVFIRANSPSVHNISCNIESTGNCKVNMCNFYIRRVDLTQNVQIQLNNRRIKLPPLNDGNQMVFYTYDYQKDKWLPSNKRGLELILKEKNLPFDISSIPDDAIINNYEIQY